MTKFKVNKTKNYTVMSNTHLKERKMTLKAKGLLSLMLSLPEKWDYSIKGLVNLSKDNETSVTSALKELKNMGYLRIKKLMPNETKTGRIEYIYDIYEEPFIQKQDPEILGLEKQGVEILGLEFLGLENQGQLNTKELNTKELNTKELNTKDKIINSPVSPKQDEIPYQEIIDYLNLKVGTHYRVSSNKTKTLIKARYNEKYTLEDFKKVIDNKCEEWLNDVKMKNYLRPETLFGSKFESYLNQKSKQPTEWFDKSNKNQEPTEEEQQEIDSLIDEITK